MKETDTINSLTYMRWIPKTTNITKAGIIVPCDMKLFRKFELSNTTVTFYTNVFSHTMIAVEKR